MQKKILHVEPKYLLLIAGIVWLVAGFNILRIGIHDFAGYWQHPFRYAMESFTIFALFVGLIFYRLVQKHNSRILNIQKKKVPFYLFFDKKSYIIMIFMISGGMLFRNAHVAPDICIGIMYCGIGAALEAAGVLFIHKFMSARDLEVANDCNQNQTKVE